MTHRLIRLTAVFACLLMSSLSAGAATVTPLVIIRFNQPNVYYQQSLYQAVSRAVEVKPQVRFDVLALSPLSGNGNDNKRLEERTQQQAMEVLHALEEMGIPSSRLAYRLEHSPAARSGEVHIFAR